MNHTRAVKYRGLALAEPDKEKAELLYQIADEADRGVLFTAEWLWERSLIHASLLKPRPSSYRGLNDREWKQWSNAIAALSTNALKQNT